ncbi:MAG: restriction endonuclease [bacterium]
MGYYEDKKNELQDLLGYLQNEKAYYLSASKQERRDLNKEEKRLNKLKEGVFQMAKERQRGFPWLAKAYDELFALEESKLVNYLRKKKRPAKAASDVIKEQSRLRRKAEKEKKEIQYIIEYYETIAPFLLDFKEEVVTTTEDRREYIKDYTEEELDDPATNYLTKEEYRKLPSVEKNQMALDRFWERPKSKWLIGRIYERYVGYLYEKKGYDVNYIGIFKGFEDLGRDLICKKDEETIVIQCKYWSQFKTIYEKHIFQFFGTVFQYRDEHPNENVTAYFYTSTKLSDLARRFSKELNIELKENFKFDKSYPCIKCNISRKNGEKIYHLPIDQQYDKVKIEPETGEFYCATVKEAEEKGFRRAFRYKGYKNE